MKKSQNLNGKIVCETKTHWVALVIPSIISFLFAISSIQGVITEKEDRIFYLFFLIVSILLFAIPYISNKETQLILTDKELYGRTGIIKVRKLSSPISKIQTVNVEATPMGRILGYRTLTVHCITGVYELKKQVNAEIMRNEIIKLSK